MKLTLEEETHTYRIGGNRADSPTGVIKAMGLIYEGPTRRGDGLDAFAVGRAAHKGLEYYAVGRLDWATVDPRIKGYVESGARWIDAHVKRVIAVEERRFNEAYMLAGQIDFRGETDLLDGPMIIDFTVSAVAHWKCIQTSAYQILAGMEHRRGCLNLKEDGSLANWVPHNDPMDWQVFLGLLSAHRTRVKYKAKELTNVNE